MNFFKMALIAIITTSCATALGAPKKVVRRAAAQIAMRKGAARNASPRVQARASQAANARAPQRRVARAAVIGAVRLGAQRVNAARRTRIAAGRPAAGRARASQAARQPQRTHQQAAPARGQQFIPAPAVPYVPASFAPATPSRRPNLSNEERELRDALEAIRRMDSGVHAPEVTPAANSRSENYDNAELRVALEAIRRIEITRAPEAINLRPAADDDAQLRADLEAIRRMEEGAPRADVNPLQNRADDEAQLRADLEAIRLMEESEAAKKDAAKDKDVKKDTPAKKDDKKKPAAKPAAKKEEPKKEKKKAQPCGICMDESANMHTLSCDHEFCADCLERMVATAENDKSTATIKCPNVGCKKKLLPSDLKKLIKDPKKIAALEAIAKREASREIGGLPGMKQCPNPECFEVFYNPDNRAQNYECPGCKQHYCSNCLLRHDRPRTTCDDAKSAANVKPGEDRANEQWKRQNTKQCPQCHGAIERQRNADGSWAACNHMTCVACRYEFCWDCSRNTRQACGCIYAGLGVRQVGEHRAPGLFRAPGGYY